MSDCQLSRDPGVRCSRLDSLGHCPTPLIALKKATVIVTTPDRPSSAPMTRRQSRRRKRATTEKANAAKPERKAKGTTTAPPMAGSRGEGQPKSAVDRSHRPPSRENAPTQIPCHAVMGRPKIVAVNWRGVSLCMVRCRLSVVLRQSLMSKDKDLSDLLHEGILSVQAASSRDSWVFPAAGRAGEVVSQRHFERTDPAGSRPTGFGPRWVSRGAGRGRGGVSPAWVAVSASRYLHQRRVGRGGHLAGLLALRLPGMPLSRNDAVWPGWNRAPAAE
jgi:hypothetical protein